MNEAPISENPFDADDKSGSRSLIIGILVIAVLCCGALLAGALFLYKPDPQELLNQYFPSPTASATATLVPTSTPTSTPTNTPTPTPNLTATLQAQNMSTALADTAKWRVILKETFDSNKNKWLVKPSDDEYALIDYKIADGKYTWDVTAHKSFISWVKVSTKALGDFYLSTDIKQSSGPDTTDYGLVFREDADSNFYYFALNEKGQYSLYLYNKEWSSLIDWTQSDLIHPGETNHITVIGEGSHFTFFINDQFLTEVTDDTLAKGFTALAVELADADDHAIFEFDNVELRTP